MDAKETVQRYHDAWRRHEYDDARRLLHDDLDFAGPLDTFDRADDFIEAIKALAPVVKDVEVRKTFVDGTTSASSSDMVTNGAGTQPIAEWYSVRHGKIASLRVFFDARPFAALSPG